MGGFFDSMRRVFKGRQKDRFSVTGKAIVIIAPSTDNEKRVQILDISKGGLAFVYDGSKEELIESGIMKLMAENETFLEKVHFETASDIPLENESGYFRRRGVRFKWMGVFDQAKLDDFINDVRTCSL
ncbi:MAG: hypothetical protein CVU61_16550 [Deltaproteobacteria bacterium HGW-Deltaproteobacteria-19]|jgi:c-di-GMP-binding flagellar brake protein YcgR|nr:MAG: hypothetical protein CVU61_16550 [Deltaproteobacteria bacterium HGW-Deltaproteobacteria-19]